MKSVSPTRSYSLTFPDDIEEDYEDVVASFWRPGGRVALQISTCLRNEGRQVEAAERLADRLARDDPKQAEPFPTRVAPPDCSFAAARVVDACGLVWIHAYMTWPDLALYATVSGPADELADTNNWAFEALHSVKRIMQ